MPQLNPEFFISQLFWLAVFFTFLFVFLWRVSLPRIATVLEKRQNKIDENLSSAKELQEQAMEIEKKINDQINKAKLETDEKIFPIPIPDPITPITAKPAPITFAASISISPPILN